MRLRHGWVQYKVTRALIEVVIDVDSGHTRATFQSLVWLKAFTRSLLFIDLIPHLAKEFGHLIHDLTPEGVWRRRETLGTSPVGFGADPLLTGDGDVWCMYSPLCGVGPWSVFSEWSLQRRRCTQDYGIRLPFSPCLENSPNLLELVLCTSLIDPRHSPHLLPPVTLSHSANKGVQI